MQAESYTKLLSQDWMVLAVLLALGLVVVLLIGLLRTRQGLRQTRQQQEALQADLRALVSAAIGVGERVHRIEKSLREVSHRQEQIDQTDPGAQAYQQAIKMAQKGSSAEELIEICGLTRGEADLIAMLHRMERSF